MLLLDEPLSALDAKVRAQLRDEIRRIQLEVGITTLFVTHDQEEALAIADRVGVMRDGRLEQLAPPTEVYSRPATSFVAEFVGLSNRLAGEVRGGEVIVRGCTLPLVERDTPDGQVVALVRPEAVTLASDAAAESGPLTGTVIAVTFLGATSRVTVDLGDTTVLAQLPTSDAAALSAGSRVALTIRPDPVLVSAGSDPAARRPGKRRERSATPPLTTHRRLGHGAVLRQRAASSVPGRRDRRGRAAPRPRRLRRGRRRAASRDAAPAAPLLCLVHITDLQLADVQSPTRFEFLNARFADPRYAEIIPVQRPQEALTVHAVDATLRTLSAVHGPATGLPLQLAVTTGDAIDNAQWNELQAFLALFDGGAGVPRFRRPGLRGGAGAGLAG